MFDRPENVNIYGGTFLDITNAAADDELKTLLKEAVISARHDGAGDFERPKCHPETRTAVLDRIERWAERSEPFQETPVLWLDGPAGAGKSAIAQTLCEKWESTGILIASFFFSRTADRRNESRYLVPTLAYQLAITIPSTRSSITCAIRDDPGLFDLSLKSKVRKLIVDPLRIVCSERALQSPYIIVLDGLDECSLGERETFERHQREILESISFIIGQQLPLLFLICSRPESQIRESFGINPLKDLTTRINLNSGFNPEADIELFLQCKFDEIKRLFPFIERSWPPMGVISRLVERSSGQFIYPSTIVRFLTFRRGDPRVRLEAILGNDSSAELADRPFSALDALYSHILHSISAASMPIVKVILGWLCYNFKVTGLFSDSPNSASFFERLFHIPSGQIHIHLTDLHSILDVPPSTPRQTRRQRISFIHASFSDFLTNKSRSGSFFLPIEDVVLHKQIALLKHVFCSLFESHWPIGLNLGCLIVQFTTNLERCVPSHDLQEGLEVLMSNDRQLYQRYLRNIGVNGLGDQLEYRIYDFLTWQQQREVWKYLITCNPGSTLFSDHLHCLEEELAKRQIIHLEHMQRRAGPILKHLRESDFPGDMLSFYSENFDNDDIRYSSSGAIVLRKQGTFRFFNMCLRNSSLEGSLCIDPAIGEGHDGELNHPVDFFVWSRNGDIDLNLTICDYARQTTGLRRKKNINSWIRAENGDINIRLCVPCRNHLPISFCAESRNGDILVLVPPNIRGSVNAQTANGSVYFLGRTEHRQFYPTQSRSESWGVLVRYRSILLERQGQDLDEIVLRTMNGDIAVIFLSNDSEQTHNRTCPTSCHLHDGGPSCLNSVD